ncbi:MAG: carboxypeptidase regulatory-like domain-containing protein [Bacteroidota bacterium]
MKQPTLKFFLPALLLGGMILFISMKTTPTVAPDAELGSISGKITYDGSVPKLNPIQMNKACSALHDGDVQNQSLVLGDGNALANVFIHIKNAPQTRQPVPTTPVDMTITGCLYTPRVVGVQVGQPLNFKNSDGILHNVHGLPKVNREFNIGMPPNLKEKEVTFNKPEPVFKVKCDVHPWMTGYVAVMTHPYFAVTDETGHFRIPNLPDGTYEIEAWHEKLPKVTKTVVVQRGSATVDIAFKPPRKK